MRLWTLTTEVTAVTGRMATIMTSFYGPVGRGADRLFLLSLDSLVWRRYGIGLLRWAGVFGRFSILEIRGISAAVSAVIESLLAGDGITAETFTKWWW